MSATNTTEEAVSKLMALTGEPPEPEAAEPEATEETNDADILEDDAETPPADDDDGDTEDDGEDIQDEDDDETEEDPPEEPEEQSFTVRVDGEEQTVTLEELKRGYAGQGYIQKQMNEVAATRKQAEAAFQALNNERAQFAQFLEGLDANSLREPQEPDPEMSETDPLGYMQAEAHYKKELRAYQQQKAEIEAQMQQHQRVQAEANRLYLAEQRKLMAEFVPELNDPETAEPHFRKLVKAGQDFGYSPEELGGITDARAVRVLEMARKYMELQSGTKTAKAKVKKARPVVKPGAKQQQRSPELERQKRLQKLKQTGSKGDALAALAAMMEE